MWTVEEIKKECCIHFPHVSTKGEGLVNVYYNCRGTNYTLHFYKESVWTPTTHKFQKIWMVNVSLHDNMQDILMCRVPIIQLETDIKTLSSMISDIDVLIFGKEEPVLKRELPWGTIWEKGEYCVVWEKEGQWKWGKKIGEDPTDGAPVYNMEYIEYFNNEEDVKEWLNCVEEEEWERESDEKIQKSKS